LKFSVLARGIKLILLQRVLVFKDVIFTNGEVKSLTIVLSKEIMLHYLRKIEQNSHLMSLYLIILYHSILVHGADPTSGKTFFHLREV
jgi:hypothetical protein